MKNMLKKDLVDIKECECGYEITDIDFNCPQCGKILKTYELNNDSDGGYCIDFNL